MQLYKALGVTLEIDRNELALSNASTSRPARLAGLEDHVDCCDWLFLSQLDATVVNVSLTTLAVELHSSLTAIQWVYERPISSRLLSCFL